MRMYKNRQLPMILALLAVLAPIGAARLQAAPAVNPLAPDLGRKSRFIRTRSNEAGEPVALETATVRYVPASGEGDLVVDLIGAVHVGESSYYQALNRQFEQYDVLLYELVAEQGTRVDPDAKRSNHPIALVQHLTTMVLELNHQMDEIDYTKKNFVHADLSPQEMAEAIRKRGDNGLTLMLSVAADLMRQTNLDDMQRENNPNGLGLGEEDFDPFSLFLDPYGASKLKRVMASQFNRQFADGVGFGKTIEQILISDRNKAAMKVFQRELAKGRTKIGIFYGAAHMQDFEKRLLNEFGLKRLKTQWTPAWNLELKSTGTGLDKLLKILDR